MVGGDQYLVALFQPARQVVGQENVCGARGVAVLTAVQAVTVASVVDVHRVHQQEVRCVAAAQVLGVGQQVRIGIVVGPVERAMLDRQLGRMGMAIAQRVEGRAVVQFAHPVIGRRRRAQARLAGVVEHAALVGQAVDVVVHDAAVDGWNAGEDALVQRARQRRELAFDAVQRGAVGFDVGMQVAHGVVGYLMVEAVEQDQDDVVLHGGSNEESDKLQATSCK